MSRIFFAIGLILAVSSGQVFAENATTQPVCYNDKISNANDVKIRMVTGLTFNAYPGSAARLSTWLPLDKVTICRIGGSAVKITNLSEKNQSINALRQKP